LNGTLDRLSVDSSFSRNAVKGNPRAMVESATVVSGSSPPPRKRLPRILFILFGSAAVLVAIAAATAPWAFSNAALRAEIASQIRHMTGLATLSQGRAVLVVLPQPHVSIDDVSFTDPSGALRIDARYLKVYVRLASLFAGRIEIASATLGQPDMRIDLDGRPMPPVIGRAADALSATAEAASADETRLGIVTLADGRVRLLRKQLSPDVTPDVTIDAINVTLDWRKPRAAAILTGQAQISGETAAIAAWIASPAGLLRGQQSPLSLKIDAPSISLSADGGLASMPAWQFSGNIHAATPSVRAILERAGYPMPLPGPFGDFEASCDATVSARSVVLSGLHLKFDGNEFEGTLAFQARDPTPVLSGTLATNRLSLQPFLSGFPPAAGHDGQWNRDPFELSELGSADLDLRISAAHMLFSHFEIEDAAFSVMRNSGRLELALAGAKAYQGTIRGRVTFDMGANGVGMQAAGAISGADLAALSFDALGWPEFYGSLTGTANLDSTGASMSELMRNLDGAAQIDVAQGQLGGIDLESALHRIDKSPLALLADIHRGRTAFDHASSSLHFAKGVATIEEGKLENPSLWLGFGGSVDFGERGLDLHAVAKPAAGAAASGKDDSDFRFDIVGSWDDLAFTPDVRGLIRRSGAAAPLFSQQHDASKPLVPNVDGGQ
jgi:AsmA protein